VYENRVLRRIFGPKREEVAGGSKILHKELQNLYASPNIIRLRWADHVARIGKMRNAYDILDGNPERKNHSEDLGVDGKIIPEWILGKKGGKLWT
jgi:hypothetical protein